jgi:hypothetical protein
MPMTCFIGFAHLSIKPTKAQVRAQLEADTLNHCIAKVHKGTVVVLDSCLRMGLTHQTLSSRD